MILRAQQDSVVMGFCGRLYILLLPGSLFAGKIEEEIRVKFVLLDKI